nr:homocysteine S-methyltransferase family protein [Clostridiales bacterium]
MKISKYLKNHILYLDGSMGTLLQSKGLLPGEYPERWNISHPDIVVGIHTRYYDAGSNVVLTNTFGANSLKFSPEELDAIVSAAVANAREAARRSKGTQEKWVGLDIGPSGRMLKPYGDLDFEDAVQVFSETVKAGVRAGADLIFIETMNDSYETKAALLAVKENCSLPVFVSNTYGADGRLMTGASPAAMVAMLEGMGADAVGVNCSLGPKALIPVIEEYLRTASVPVLCKPNAGMPWSQDGKTVFDIGPEEFSLDMTDMISRGVRIAGGCCGTDPEFIRRLVSRSAGLDPLPIVRKNITVVSSYTRAVEFGNVPVLIGERINPTGKKLLKHALKDHDMDYLLEEGISQQDQGAHILDVNVGLPGIDESSMLCDAVCALQAVVGLPLQIDSASPGAMESALRRYNGKPMINSVNGREESMRAVFPLAKKYGGVIVALTLDENGIPDTAAGRVAIARKILVTARKYGISKKDLIFDPLAMAVSAAPGAADVALESLRIIRNSLGCHTSLGVSNISFGLPNRDMINSTFFVMALQSGLSAAIMNPRSADMMKAYRAYLALQGKDADFKEYLKFCNELPEMTSSAVATQSGVSALPLSSGSALQEAIIKGLKDRAADLAQADDPLELINKHIIPALDVVGKGFEKKEVYLPQLLMSAEAAKSAFEQIKKRMPADSRASVYKHPFIIATVQGDIHDIGKNIVKLLLENYGFPVIDLGKDVSPETIV